MAEEKGWVESIKERASGMLASMEDAGKSAVGKTKELANEAKGKIVDYGKQADDASDGWLGNNKGLLIGGAVALLALFGMEGGFMPMLLAVGALLAGIFMDKDTGIFKEFLGKKEEPTKDGQGLQLKHNSPAPQRNQQPDVTAPVVPSTEGNITDKELPSSQTVNVSGITNIFYVDKQGNRKKSLEPDLMVVRVDNNGKVIDIAVANKDGKFDKNPAEGKTEEILTTKVENIEFEVKTKSDGKALYKYIDLGDKATKEKLHELREIGTKALLDRAKLRKASIGGDDIIHDVSLNDVRTQGYLPNIKGSQIQI